MRSIPFGKPIIGDAERQAVMAVLAGSTLVHGPLAKKFEEVFADFTAAPHAVSVASCTAAMHLVYFHLGFGPGDEVVVPAQTHTATAHAVELVGAKPVFVDCEAGTGNIDVAAVAAAITPRTRAIAVVHYLGVPVDMAAITALARQHGLFVLEDCALAIGTRLDGIHAGLHGDVGCFSFYPVKHMTTAEGGMIICRDPQLAAQLQRKKAFGVDRTVGERTVPGMYDVTMLGFNYRMNEIEAAIGIEQVGRLPDMLERRRANSAVLRDGLRGVAGIGLLEDGPAGGESSHYCLSAILDDSLAARRLSIIKHLNAAGIGTSIYYPRPVPLMSYYRGKYGFNEGDFPQAERISNNSIALPVGPHLDEEDMAYIANAMADAVKESK
ncbi:aminotransferase class I/II-fold pyridoxal phosphate-dependent enzyme [Azospirillum brasilense]|nr:aminotransferase class I/II-fold pyridoxal phosphate-dependent enzyme [Azospirillum brasilense]